MRGNLSIEIQKRLLQAQLNISLESRQRIAILGPSGSGKTTLLRCLAGLEMPDSGVIRFGENTWFQADSKKIQINWPPQRRGIGYVSQEYSLFPHLSVEENIKYGVTKKCRTPIFSLIAKMDLKGLEKRYPAQLSGGQRQRVALARAIAIQPCILLLDEPFSALDSMTRGSLRPFLRDLLDDIQIPALIVTHDLSDVWALANQVIQIDGGKAHGPENFPEVYAVPRTAALTEILGVETFWEGLVEKVEKDRVFIQLDNRSVQCRSASELQPGMSVQLLSSK